MKSRLARNVLANILQTLLGSGLLFALYRYINTTLGVEKLGVWSVVLATVSVSRLADLGLSAGVTRFVARDRTRGNTARAAQVVDTTFLTLLVTVGVFLPVLYPAIKWALPHFLQNDNLVDATAILPFALLSLWLSVASSVIQGGLTGCERIDLQSVLVVIGQALMLALAVILVPRYGLIGLAVAQIGQTIFVLFVGRLLLCRVLPSLTKLPRGWNRSVFRELFFYSINIQAASLAMLVFDASTKIMMARFGGASAVGFFEMANQLVLKVRTVIVTANQAIVPHVVTIAEQKPSGLNSFYRANIRMLTFFVLPIFALLFAWAGGFSWLLAGVYQPQFVTQLWIVGIAWFFNIFSGPAYFNNQGTGRVGWNAISHISMGIANIFLGWTLGTHYGQLGVVAGYAIALAIGSAILIVSFQSFQRAQNVTPAASDLTGFRYEHIGLFVTCAAVSLLAWMNPVQPDPTNMNRLMMDLLLPPLVLAMAMWLHPLRRELLGFARQAFSKKP